MAIVCRLGAITGSSLTVAQGSRTVGRCCHVSSVVGSFAVLGTLVASVRSLVASLGRLVVSVGPLVPIRRGPVSMLAGLGGLLGAVVILRAATTILVHDAKRIPSSLVRSPSSPRAVDRASNASQ